MTDTKLDADLAAYEERHEKLEAFLADVKEACELVEKYDAIGFVHDTEIALARSLMESAKKRGLL